MSPRENAAASSAAGDVSVQNANGAAPVFPRSEFARVAAAIREALEPNSDFASAPAAGPLGATPGVVRTINLQLHPDMLGVIHVRMRLSGDELSLELRASRAETARLIEADGGLLSEHLRAAGYDPSLLVERARPEPASADLSREGPGGQGGQPAPGGAESGASWQGRGGFTSAQRFSGGTNDLSGRGEGLAGETTNPGRAGGVYL